METAAGELIERTLHFELEGEGPYTLGAFGRRHRLERHSPATLAASPELRRGGAKRVTHYARVAHPPDVVQLIRVYGPPDADGIPSLERLAVCTPDDAGAYTRADLARAILFLHPGLTVLTAEHAPMVLDHIGASPSFAQLSFLLENMDGPWNQVVKLTDAAGAPLRDRAGKPLYRYDLAALVENQRTAVAREALVRVNGDAALRAVRWNTSNGVPRVDISPSRTNGAADGALAPGYRYKLQDPGPKYGLSAEVLSLTDDLELRLRLRNDYVRHGSVFISLVGGDGKTAIPVPAESWIQSLADDLRGLVRELTDDFHTRAPFILDGKNELNFLGTLGAETTFLGIPVSSSSSDFTFTLPKATPSGRDATISKVRILCGSLGLRTDNEWDPLAAWIGIALTAFLDIAIPTVSLVATVGTTSNALFDSIFKDVKFLGPLVLNVVLAVKDSIENPDEAGEDVKNFFLALGDTIVQKVLTAADVATKLAAYFGGEELAEAIPIAGWALKAEAIEATIEQLAQTVGEVVGSPRVVEFDLTITMDARLTLRPSEKGGFASRAHHYTITAQYSDVTGYVYTADVPNPDVDRIDALWKDIPVGGTVKFLVAVYSEEGWLVGRGASDTIANAVTPGEGALVVPPITVQELLYPLTKETTYGHQQLLAYQAGAHRWIRSSVAPPQTVKDLETGDADHGLDALTSLGLNSDLGVLGYSWEASGQNVPILGTQEPIDEVCYTFQNVSYGPEPEAGLMFTPAGYGSSPLLGYLRSSAGGDAARAFFYLDPVADGVGAFHLRSIAPVTDPAVSPESPRRRFDLARTQSWGRFRIRPTAIALHPNGCVVAVSSGLSKLQILELPDGARPPGQAPWAQVLSGPGLRAGLLGLPELVAIAPDQTIYVLEAGNARIQAFSRGGHPVPAFPTLPTPYWIPLHADPGDSSAITYTSMSVEIQGHIYVSSYEDTGYEPRQFRLDIYSPDGTHLLRQRGVNVARQAVDLWRNLYTVNFQRVLGPGGRTEPSVSEWVPFTPKALAGLRAGGSGFQVRYPGAPTLLGSCLVQNTYPPTGGTWNMRTYYQEWNWDQQQPQDVDGYGVAVFDLDGGNDATTWNLWWVGPNRCALQAGDSGRFIGIAEYGQGNFRAQPFVSHDRPSPAANTSADPYGYFAMAHLGGGIVSLLSLDPGGGAHPLSFRYGEYFEPFDSWNVIRAIDGAPGTSEALRLAQLDPLVILLLSASGVGLDLRGKDLTFGGRITSIAGVDFSGAHLEGAKFGALTDLAGCNFTGAHLNGASLVCRDPGRVVWAGADLSGVDMREFLIDPGSPPDFSRTTLDGANLGGLPLFGVHFDGASMKGADLTGADARGAGFAGADLQGAHLDGVTCLGADFTGANLAGATLAGAKLGRAKLQGARFDGCDLTRTTLGEAPQFGRSTAARTRFVNATIPAAQLGSDWSYLDLTGAKITGIPEDLAGLVARETLFPTLVELRGVKLSGAHLEQARMYYADLKGADLGGAILDGALLKGANLAGANLAGASLKDAYLIAETNVDDPDKYEAAQATDAFLVNTCLDGARCDGVDFVGALFITYAPLSPRPASADGAFLNGAKLNDAKIIGVSFRGAQLAGVNLSNAVLVASTFPSAMLTPASDAQRSPASLYRADLRGARFADLGPGGRAVNPASMDGCDLTGATVATAPGTFQQVYEDYDGKRLPLSVGYDATVLGTTTPATHCPDGSKGPCTIAPREPAPRAARAFPVAAAVARPPEATEREPAQPIVAPSEAPPPVA